MNRLFFCFASLVVISVLFTFQMVTPDLSPSDNLGDTVLRELNRMTGASMEDSADLNEAEITRHRKLIPFVGASVLSLLAVLVLYPIMCCLCNSKKSKDANQPRAAVDQSDDEEGLPIIV